MPRDRSRSVCDQRKPIHLTLISYVELSIRGPVAEALPLALHLAHGRIRELVPYRTAHDTQPLEVSGQIRVLLEQQANVGKGAGRYQPCSVRRRCDKRAIHGLEMAHVGGSGLDRLREQRHAVEAALAVDISRVHGIAHDGLRGAGVDLDVASAQCFQYRPRVEGGLIEGGVAVDGANP